MCRAVYSNPQKVSTNFKLKVANMETMDESRRLFTIRKTIFSMLSDRGYLVPQPTKEEKFEDFEAKYADNQRLILYL